MVGIVDVGGGMRGIYGAGVFDCCMERHIRFDYCIGVSAGSANIASYLAGQPGRNYRFYMEYSFRRRYMSLHNLLHMGSYIDLDYVYSGLSNHDGENPLDYDAFRASPAVMKVVALNALTGTVQYFDKRDMGPDSYHILKASSSLPLVCRPYEIGGVPYFDGGLADPVPVRKAFDDGCDRVVVVLTRPADFQRSSEKDARMARRLEKSYPQAARRLLARADLYNKEVALAQEYARQGRVLLIAPDNICGMKTLTRSRRRMDAMYRKGRGDAAAISAFLTDAQS